MPWPWLPCLLGFPVASAESRQAGLPGPWGGFPQWSGSPGRQQVPSVGSAVRPSRGHQREARGMRAAWPTDPWPLPSRQGPRPAPQPGCFPLKEEGSWEGNQSVAFKLLLVFLFPIKGLLEFTILLIIPAVPVTMAAAGTTHSDPGPAILNPRTLSQTGILPAGEQS